MPPKTRKEIIEQIDELTNVDFYQPKYFGIDEHKINLSSEVNPYGLRAGRVSLASASIGLMLLNKDPKYTVEDIMDMSKLTDERIEFGKKAEELYKKQDSKSLAEALVATVRECYSFMKENRTPGMIPQDYFEYPKNLFFKVQKLFGDSMQEITNRKHGSQKEDNDFFWKLTDATPEEIKKYDNITTIYSMTTPYYSQLFKGIKSLLSDSKEINTLSGQLSQCGNILIADDLLTNEKFAGMNKDTEIIPGFTPAIMVSSSLANTSLHSEITEAISTEEGKDFIVWAALNNKIQSKIIKNDNGVPVAASDDDIKQLFNDRNLKKDFYTNSEVYKNQFLNNIADTSQVIKNATSNDHFTIWKYQAEKDKMMSLNNTLGLEHSRNALQTMVIGRLLIEHPETSFDEIFDPSKLIEEKAKICSEVKTYYEGASKHAKYNEYIESLGSHAYNPDDPFASLDDKQIDYDPEHTIDNFGKYAAEAYIKILESGKQYVKAHENSIKSFKDSIQPENRAFTGLAIILQVAAQNADKDNVRPYVLNLPGMTEEKFYDLQDNFQIPTNVLGMSFNNTIDAVNYINNNNELSVPYLRQLFMNVLQNKRIQEAVDKGQPLFEDQSVSQKFMDAKEPIADAFDLYSKASDRVFSRVNNLLKTSEGKDFLFNAILIEDPSKLGFYVEDGNDGLDLDILDKYLLEKEIQAMIKTEANKLNCSVSELLAESVLGTGDGDIFNDPENAVNQTIAALKEGKKVYFYTNDGNGSNELHEIKNGKSGLTLSSEKMALKNPAQKKALLNMLSESYKVLKGTGRSGRDSDEYSAMMDTFEKSLDTVKNSLNEKEINKAVNSLIEKAENYYLAKVSQSHNSKRSTRFAETMKLINMKSPKMTDEKEMILDALALKITKANLEAFSNSSIAEDAVRAQSILNDKSSLYKAAESTRMSEKFSQLYGGKSINSLKKSLAVSGSKEALKYIAPQKGNKTNEKVYDISAIQHK